LRIDSYPHHTKHAPPQPWHRQPTPHQMALQPLATSQHQTLTKTTCWPSPLSLLHPPELHIPAPPPASASTPLTSTYLTKWSDLHSDPTASASKAYPKFLYFLLFNSFGPVQRYNGTKNNIPLFISHFPFNKLSARQRIHFEIDKWRFINVFIHVYCIKSVQKSVRIHTLNSSSFSSSKSSNIAAQEIWCYLRDDSHHLCQHFLTAKKIRNKCEYIHPYICIYWMHNAKDIFLPYNISIIHICHLTICSEIRL
jgi:hypothetical protein